MDNILEIKNLTKYYGKVLGVENLTLSLKKGECFGFIGPNGAGKSTLLRIISGELEPTEGVVTYDKNERMSVLKQDHNAFDDVEVLRTVLLGHKRLVEIMDQKEKLYAKPDFSEKDGELAGQLETEFAELDGWNAETDAENLLNSLGVPLEYEHMLMKELDSKMKVKVLLAQALFGNPDILILDEPTNNLDNKACHWLEDYLADFENTLLIVSHDRYFLNKVCTRILDVDYNEIKVYVGNYDFWYESSQLLLRQMKDSNAKKEERIKELQDFIARFSANASKSRQATSRKKLLEKIQLDDIKPSSRRYPFIDFNSEFNLGNDILKVEEVSKGNLFKKLSFNLLKTDRVAFLADNSLAITTLFNCLANVDNFDEGSYKYGITVHPSYIPSSLSEFDNIDESLVDYLRPYSKDQNDSYIRGFLGRMLFSGEEVLKKVNVLSGGEKVRCMLSKMMLSGANLLMLDQPTDHLDVETITSLNEALINFKGAILFSTHDHEFIETTANRIIDFKDDGKYVDKMTTYEEYLKLNK